MRKTILLAGAAAFLMSSGMAAANEQYQPKDKLENFQLKLGGTGIFEAGASNYSNVDNGGYDFRSSMMFDLHGSGTMDNGMEYGIFSSFGDKRESIWTPGTAGAVNIATPNTRDILMRTYGAYISGGFGDVRFGDDFGAAHSYSVYAPGFGEDTMIDGNYWRYAGTMLPAHKAMDTDNATKLSYYTPDFNGFSAGVSYAPTLSNGDSVSMEHTNSFNDGIEAGVGYKQSFSGDFDVNLGATVMHTTPGDTAEDAGAESLTTWSTGAQVGIRGITLGGSFNDYDSLGIEDGMEVRGYNFGAHYAIPDTKVELAANWNRSVFDGTDTYTSDVYMGGAAYRVAPGMRLMGEVSYVDDEDETPGADDESGWVGLVRTEINF